MASQLTLPDGRTLDYSVFNDKGSSVPLIWHHGTPGAFTPIPALLKACEKSGQTLITFSRAGYGGSSRRKGRSIADDVEDVRALMEHLGIKKVIIGGTSGGGPHALACAAKLKGCLAVICVAGVAPYAGVEDLDWLAGQGQDNIDEFNATMKGEPFLKEYCEAQRAGLANATAEGIVEEMSTLLPECDKRVLLDDKEFGVYVQECFHEGLKNSADGWVDDSIAFLQPWGFDVADIQLGCSVFLYQGSEDMMVPFSHGEWLGKHIAQKNLTTHLEQGEGHLSIFNGGVATMMKEIEGIIDSWKL